MQAAELEEGELSPAAPETKPAETPQQAKRRAKLEEARRAEVRPGCLWQETCNTSRFRVHPQRALPSGCG